MLRNIFSILVFSLIFTEPALADFAEHLSQSKNFLAQGQYRLAVSEAKIAAEDADSIPEKARADGLLGNLYLTLKEYNLAEKHLLSAFEHSDDFPLEKAGYANNLGILYSTLDKNRDTCSATCAEDNALDQQYSSIDKSSKAENYFNQAQQLAGDNQSLLLNIKLNRFHNKPETATKADLDTLFRQISQLPSLPEKAKDTVSLAAISKYLDSESQDLSLRALEQVKTETSGLDDIRLRTEILANLAELYEKKGKEDLALKLSEDATNLESTNDIQDLLVDLEWRKGRIYQKLGQDDLSLAAYGKAVDYVQAIRNDIPVEYHEGHSSFRETLEPIYLGYAYQLLKKAGHQDGELKQKTLLLARQTVELIKQTEMEDFMGGRCFIEGLRRSELDNRDDSAATLYPIILPDRLELLVSFDKTIHQYTVPVKEIELRTTASNFAEKLRNMAENHEKDSKKLYQWLIAPMEAELASAKIKTLVVVPDGVLRLVPFSALNNGQHYLLENYALTISPGMSLMGGGNTDQRTYQSLLVGLSRPGKVVEKLPADMIAGILNPDEDSSSSQRSIAGNHVVRAVNTGNAQKANALEVDKLLKNADSISKLQDALSLPGVENELNNVKQSLNNTTLLNDTFTVDNFHQQVSTQPYEIIHIASHGIFTSDAETSFIMAHDNLLKINDLQNLLKGEKAGKSIDLLTLSACETAKGDDRAPMGFSGIALKANARSAIGSLWPISDEAASLLMDDFYKNLTQIHHKAEALRQSQLKLLKTPGMSHPYFWSPFILVGNWI
jgi:CHAT domain-containing protein